MFKNSSDDKNNGNDGFVWSSRATMAIGFVFALALAAARFAPILAARSSGSTRSTRYFNP
jgi:hypothetical protein